MFDNQKLVQSGWNLLIYFLLFLGCFFIGFDPFDPISALFLTLLLIGFSEVVSTVAYLAFRAVMYVYKEYTKINKQ